MTPTRPFSLLIAMLFLLATGTTALAVAADECERQRARYPKDWDDLSKEKPLLVCKTHSGGWFGVMLGPSDNQGRRLMSFVPIRPSDHMVRDPDRPLRRIWLDAEQARRLTGGKYFATVLRKEDSCWVRDGIDENSIFLIDEARPKQDRPDAGSFYNKAPRTSAFGNEAVYCRPPKKDTEPLSLDHRRMMR